MSGNRAERRRSLPDRRMRPTGGARDAYVVHTGRWAFVGLRRLGHHGHSGTYLGALRRGGYRRSTSGAVADGWDADRDEIGCGERRRG